MTEKNTTLIQLEADTFLYISPLLLQEKSYQYKLK